MVTCFSMIILFFVLVGFSGFGVAEWLFQTRTIEEESQDDWVELVMFLAPAEAPIQVSEARETFNMVSHVRPPHEEDIIDLSCLEWAALEAEVAWYRASHRKVNMMRTASAIFIMG